MTQRIAFLALALIVPALALAQAPAAPEPKAPESAAPAAKDEAKDAATATPAATPKDVVTRLHDEMKKILANADLRKRIADIGLLPIDTPSIADTQTYLKSEREKWGSLVRKLGLEGTL